MSDEDRLDPRALYSISYGIYIVSSCYEGKANGQIANTVMQVCAEPPRIAVAINKLNYTHEFIDKSGVYVVSVLDEDTPMQLIGKFGFRTGKDLDKFEGVETMTLDTGCPIVTEHAISVMEAKVFDTADSGTHTIYLADVTGGKVISDGKPLTYEKYHENKGQAPKNAPTFRPAAPKNAPTYRPPEK
jgi:ferric-chelate reductase [NAD(P)H]